MYSFVFILNILVISQNRIFQYHKKLYINTNMQQALDDTQTKIDIDDQYWNVETSVWLKYVHVHVYCYEKYSHKTSFTNIRRY